MGRTFFLILFGLTFQGCIGMTNEKLLASHKLNNGAGFGIYLVEAGATANDNIQVRKGGKNSAIWFTDKYDTLLSSKLINDTSLELVLAAKGIYNTPTKSDTLLVDIK